MSRTLPIPGLAEHAIGFTTLAEAGHLRNHVLGRLDAASLLPHSDRRRSALTFTAMGAGYSGVELVAELAAPPQLDDASSRSLTTEHKIAETSI